MRFFYRDSQGVENLTEIIEAEAFSRLDPVDEVGMDTGRDGQLPLIPAPVFS